MTVTVQLAPAARFAGSVPQLFVWVNCGTGPPRPAAVPPVMLILLIVTVAAGTEVLVITTFCVVVEGISHVPNATELGERLNDGP